MRVGIVSAWCNRGQGVVARHVRSIFEEAGHETHVLARPTNPNQPIGNFVDTRGAWDVPRITAGSHWEIPKDEYVRWARDTNIEVMLCDMNLQFEEVEAVRRLGVRTIGRFVWERFSKAHVERARRAYDVIYSLTRAEQARYADMGIDSPYLRWGLPPELLDVPVERRTDGVDYIFHGGFQGLRKPIRITVEAFKSVPAAPIRLILKSQGIRETSERVDVSDDPRIETMMEDLPDEQYMRLFSSCHVCLTPARWEGLGVHLYEALALGMPVIANDIAPINEVVEDGVSGLLCKSRFLKKRGNGLPIYDPDPDDLRRCIETLADRDALDALTESTRAHRATRPWDHTKQDYLAVATGAPVAASSS